MNDEKTQKTFLLLAVLVLIGTFSASVAEMRHPELEFWTNPIFLQGTGLSGEHFGGMFWQNLGCILVWMGILLIAGLSAFGKVAAIVVMLFRGAAIGAVLTVLYRDSGFAGLLTSLLFVIPNAMTETMVLFLAARETMRCSGQITASISGKEAAEKFSVGMYLLRWLVILLMTAGITLFQSAWLTWIYPLFLNAMTNTE